jgi:8-oxo-dGTP diphosphatase
MRRSAPRLRPSARALVLDDQDRILLVNFDWPGLDLDGGFWACPGGGIELGESPRDALERELWEETGLRDPDVGPLVWTKDDIFPMPAWDGQRDEYYLVRVTPFEPRPALTDEELLAENVRAIRWFGLDDVARGEVHFSPRGLSALLADLVAHGLPVQPVHLTGH